MQSKEIKEIAVVTVVYKYPEKALRKFVTSVRKQGIPQDAIFIRENTNDNIGYAAAINEVIRKQLNKYSAFLILNPDITLEYNTIRILKNELFSDSSIGIVGPKILDENGNIWSLGGEIDKKRYSGGAQKIGKKDTKIKRSFTVDFIPGTAMLIKKEVFQKVGFLKEDYFIYYEDADFSLRTKREGFELVVVPQAEIIHKASSTVGKESPAMNYYMARNHLLFVERFATFLIKLREVVRLPKTVFQARNNKYELKGIFDYFLRKFSRNIHIKNSVDL